MKGVNIKIFIISVAMVFLLLSTLVIVPAQSTATTKANTYRTIIENISEKDIVPSGFIAGIILTIIDFLINASNALIDILEKIQDLVEPAINFLKAFVLFLQAVKNIIINE